MRDTIEMAREAGLLTWLKPPEDVIERFKAFEALVRADEREACAQVCEELQFSESGPSTQAKFQRDLCAKAIRARGRQ